MKTVADNRVQFPAYQQGTANIWLRLAHEAWDHLWPWTSTILRRQRTLAMASIVLALLVSVAWGAAALGHLSRNSVIAWWFGWSLLEVLIRHHSKPYVKEGPWWGSTWRAANWMDLLSYVLFKNLLLGSGLFLILNALGLLAD
jgi:hypothetical protein